MRDVTAENRPQMSSAGLEVNNKHFKDLPFNIYADQFSQENVFLFLSSILYP